MENTDGVCYLIITFCPVKHFLRIKTGFKRYRSCSLVPLFYSKCGTDLWSVWGVEQPQFSEGFMGRGIRTVRNGEARALHVVLNARPPPLRRAVVSARTFSRRWDLCSTKAHSEVRRRTETFLVPRLGVVVVFFFFFSGSAQRAAAQLVGSLLRAVSPQGYRRIQLGKTGLSAGTVISLLDTVIFAIAV